MRNVVLLALSTLPEQPQKNDFKVKGKDITMRDCIGQLEPVVKLRLNTANKNDTLTIIALCTDDVQNKKCSFDIDGEYITDKTALEFFTDRVNQFAETYGMTGFVEVRKKDLNADDIGKAVREAAKEVRELCSSFPENRLWIDTHGAFREVSLVMEAIVSLLKVDGIYPEHIYGVEHGKNLIVEQGESFSMFDFVSGMNEFIDFGSTNILRRYYGNNIKSGSDKTDLLLRAMNKVASGTEECDPRLYEEGLDELGEAIEELDENDSMLGIFKDYVKRSYGVLLDKDKRSVIDIIERCIDKELIQQALTFMESRMPEEYEKRKLLFCMPRELENAGLSKTQGKRKIDKYKEDANYIVDSYLSSHLSGIDGDVFIPTFLSGNVDNKKKFLKGHHHIKLTGDYVQAGPAKHFWVSSAISEEKYDDALTLMCMHKALKDCRNKYNHCDSDRPKSEDIKRLLNEYIKLARELLENDRYYINLEPKTLREEKKLENSIFSFKPERKSRGGKCLVGVLTENQKRARIAISKIKEKRGQKIDIENMIKNGNCLRVKIVGDTHLDEVDLKLV